MTCLAWWYFDEPLYLWRAIVIITKKTYFGFSIGMLLSTLFDPWKKDVISVENASLDVQFKIILDNLFSRFIGFIMRFFTIIIGLVFTSLVFLSLLILFLIWILLPVIIVALLYFGIKAVQNG